MRWRFPFARPRQLARLRRLVRDNRGNATMITAVAILPMMAGAGLATDAGRAYMVENRLSKALDAAALAAGRVLFAGSGQAEAESFFDANYPDNYLNSTVTDFTYKVGPDQRFITVTAEAQVSTTFMQVLGDQTVTVASKSIVERQNRGAEIALVMDNTGSMRGGGKMDAVVAAQVEVMRQLAGTLGQGAAHFEDVEKRPIAVHIRDQGTQMSLVNPPHALGFPQGGPQLRIGNEVGGHGLRRGNRLLDRFPACFPNIKLEQGRGIRVEDQSRSNSSAERFSPGSAGIGWRAP